MMNLHYKLLASAVMALAMLFSITEVVAKPVDCLVSDKSRTYIDGSCDFKTTDSDGSFELHSGSMVFNLMADPGAKLGRVSFNGDAQTDPWVTDVKRDGACWKYQDLSVCAWAESRPDENSVAKDIDLNALDSEEADLQQSSTTVESDAHRMGQGCPAVGSVISPPSNAKATVEFVDQISPKIAATIYWLDFDGNPVEMAIFDDNGRASLDSYVGHKFIVKDFDGSCYGGVHVVKQGHNQITVR